MLIFFKHSSVICGVQQSGICLMLIVNWSYRMDKNMYS